MERDCEAAHAARHIVTRPRASHAVWLMAARLRGGARSTAYGCATARRHMQYGS